jgi:hypothetical protein
MRRANIKALNFLLTSNDLATTYTESVYILTVLQPLYSTFHGFGTHSLNLWTA